MQIVEVASHPYCQKAHDNIGYDIETSTRATFLWCLNFGLECGLNSLRVQRGYGDEVNGTKN